MAEKKTGISRDLVIPPGETIADVLDDRGITQSELAARTGVSGAYVSSVIAGKKGISANFALALEYALGIPKSFWLNLQANYEAELLEANEPQTITEEERKVRDTLNDVVRYLRKTGAIPARESKDESILSLRKALQISNLVNLKDMTSAGAFRISEKYKVNPYVLGAWIRLCQLADSTKSIETRFDKQYIDEITNRIKNVMCRQDVDIQTDLRTLLAEYGIDFSVLMHFKGAPVQGYISKKENGVYQMVLTIRGSSADIFWFSLFHEIGHIVNGDLGKSSNFLDGESKLDQEAAADLFAGNMLLSPKSYQDFIVKADFSIEEIQKYADSQNVMPYIVIGRLQKEKYLNYNAFPEYKLRYKWMT